MAGPTRQFHHNPGSPPHLSSSYTYTRDPQSVSPPSPPSSVRSSVRRERHAELPPCASTMRAPAARPREAAAEPTRLSMSSSTGSRCRPAAAAAGARRGSCPRSTAASASRSPAAIYHCLSVLHCLEGDVHTLAINFISFTQVLHSVPRYCQITINRARSSHQRRPNPLDPFHGFQIPRT